jgi:hypothetical protein
MRERCAILNSLLVPGAIVSAKVDVADIFRLVQYARLIDRARDLDARIVELESLLARLNADLPGEDTQDRARSLTWGREVTQERVDALRGPAAWWSFELRLDFPLKRPNI